MSPKTEPTEPPGRPEEREVLLRADVAEAVLELFLCDAEIESRSRELEIVQARLAAASSSPEIASIAGEVETAIGCLLDHLRPAREVVRSVEPLCSPRSRSSGLMAAAGEQTLLRATDHLLYREFFAGVDKQTLAALRHRELCPVCARMTRILLFGFEPPLGPNRAGRSAPAGGPGEAVREGV
jgi:hypothetical protein